MSRFLGNLDDVKRLGCLITLLVSIGSLPGQTSNSWENFKSLFPRKKIPLDLQHKFLRLEGEFDKQREEFETRTARRLIKHQNFYLAEIRYDCVSGGNCEALEVYTFDFEGNLISKLEIEKRLADCVFESKKDLTHKTEQTWYILETKIVRECEDEPNQQIDLKLVEYDLSKEGVFSKQSEQTIESNRPYFDFSIGLKNRKELEKLSKDELAKIRNEIFASYGYSFKSDKWKEYFRQFEWYQPFKGAVSEDELNFFERENLKLILNLEKQ